MVRKWQMGELEHRAAINLSGFHKSPIVLVCDNIRSAHNVGSIFRSADALGVTGMVLCGITAQPPHREIFKSALGATETVPWEYAADVHQKALELKKEGFLLVGLEQTTASVQIQSMDWKNGPLAVFVGNEVDGLSESLLPVLDYFVEIPQVGSKHSLNVAVATGIAMWEIVRNRLTRL